MAVQDHPALVLVAAVAADGGIGRGNGLLFTDPLDQRHFRQVTMGKPVVMGRKTWESLPERFRPLPGRRNLVLTRNPGYVAPGAELASDLNMALRLLQSTAPAADTALATPAEVCILGGAEVYAQAMPLAQRLVITHIGKRFEGADAFFPAIDPSRWKAIDRREAVASDGTPLAFVAYVCEPPL